MKTKKNSPADSGHSVDFLPSSAVLPHGDDPSGGIPGRSENQDRASMKQVNHSRQGRPRRHRGILIGIIIVLVIVLGIAGSGYLLWQSLMDKVNLVNSAEETIPSEFNTPTESLANPIPVQIQKGIRNILLLGVDSRDEETTQTNSDSMMVLTIDEVNNAIKLTSLQRDMLVYMPGRKDPVKLNAVNSFGGPLLTIRVVNETLRLNITNYVIVNMRGMEAIIDIAGGVNINVEKDELPYLNGEVGYQNFIFPETPKSGILAKSGLQILNGRQAVSYARIRHLDSDYKRMGRQRIIIQALLDRFMAASLSTKTSMVSNGLPYITTNLTKIELTNLGLTTVPLMGGKIEQLQIPIDGFFVEDPDPIWVNRCDFNGMIPLLQKFIYGKPFPFDLVKKIPGAPNSGIALPTTRATTAKPTTTTSKANMTTIMTSESSAATTTTSTIYATTAPSTTTNQTTATTAVTTTSATTTAAPAAPASTNAAAAASPTPESN